MAGHVVSRAELHAALAALRPVVKRSPLIPVLECVRVTLESGRIEIGGTDCERWIITDRPADSPGGVAFAASFERLQRFVGAASGADVSISADGRAATLVSGRARCVIPVLPAIDWPAPSETAGGETVSIARAGLEAAVKFCRTAVTSDIGFKWRDCVFLGDVDGAPVMVTTNGQTIALAPLEGVNGGIPFNGESPHPPIPLAAIEATLSASKADVIRFAITDQRITFSWPGGRLISSLLDTNQPPWRWAIEHLNVVVTVPVKLAEIRAAVDRVVAGSGGTELGGAIAGGEMHFRSRDQKTDSEATDKIECGYAGPPIHFGLNAKFTQDALAALDGTETAYVTFTGTEKEPSGPLLLRKEPVADLSAAVRTIAQLKVRFSQVEALT